MQIDDLLFGRHDYESASSLFHTAVVSHDSSVFPFHYESIGKYRFLNELENLVDVIILGIHRLP